ncbi:MAG: hypothetical protein GYB36_11140 [Alphaproteobacteria bacterium]|nr:hypothetical protein [Alphaproteobacteria bacterium]
MDREVYLEIQVVGNAARVAAVDAETGEEVVFQVPKRTTRIEIEHLAMAKLNWKLSKIAQEKRPDDKPGRGIKV